MMENEHTALNGTTTTTTTTTTKEKQGSTPLVVLFTITLTLLLGLAFYARQPIRSSYGVGGSGGGTPRSIITAAALQKGLCTTPDNCECPSCQFDSSNIFFYFCTPPSETVHCPATASCSTTAVVFSGDNVDCTDINAKNYGYDCNEVVAQMNMNFVHWNCMEDPTRADGVCANRNICEVSSTPIT